jgi:hypothetical protein
MKSKHLLVQLLAVSLAFPFMGTSAQAASITIDVLEIFDYPGTGNQTRPQKINDDGEIVGIFVDSSGASRGFTRSRDGVFSPPIIEPNDTGNLTEGRGINNAATVCGDYLGSDGAFHGFFLSSGTFTEFDVPGATGTQVLGISNAVDFSGAFLNSAGIFQAFISLGGSVMPIDIIPDATFSGAYQLNASNAFTGYYTDSGGINHGFFADKLGRLHFPIDPVGSIGTIFFGMNDKEWIVGRYSDSAGITHGLFFVPPNDLVTYDFPGSTFTSLNGINAQGYVCGRYTDTAGIDHGFVGRVTRTRGEANNKVRLNSRPSTAKTINQSPATLRGGPPAS